MLCGSPAVMGHPLASREYMADFLYSSADDQGEIGRMPDGTNRRHTALRIRAGPIEQQLAGGQTIRMQDGQAIGTYSAHDLLLVADSLIRWRILAAGGLIAESDNAYDIGANGASRPRTAYLGTSVFIGTDPGSGILRVGQVSDGTIVAYRRTGAINNPGLFVSVTEASARTTLDASGTSGAFNLLVQAGGADAIQFDGSTTATQTRMLVYDVDNGQLERVTIGAVDSGGAGFKLLRIPN